MLPLGVGITDDLYFHPDVAVKFPQEFYFCNYEKIVFPLFLYTISSSSCK